jgi:hypothetical protein
MDDWCPVLDDIELFCDWLAKKPAILACMSVAVVLIILFKSVWPFVNETHLPDGDVGLRLSTSPLPSPAPPTVIAVSGPAQPVIVAAPAPPQPQVMPEIPPPSPTPPATMFSSTVASPQPETSCPAPRCHAAHAFRNGLYGGFELVGVDHSKKTVTVRLPPPSPKKDVEVPTFAEVEVFQANDLLGDFSCLRCGQKLSMYLRKKDDDEVVASAIFIERFR